MTRKKSAETIDLEVTLQHLQELVERMEKGQLPLEDSLKSFEEGIQLVRQCQEVLQKAEQKVQILLGSQLTAYEEPE